MFDGASDDDFSALLQRSRAALGFSQEELAERSGLSVDAISALERGTRVTPHRSTVTRLADALGLIGEARAVFESRVRRARIKTSTFVSPPVPSTAIVGRGDVLARVLELFATGARLVTLTGPGGVGKSRLAVEVAARLQHAVRDGVAFVRFENAHDEDDVVAAIGDGLGLRAGRDFASIVRFVRGKSLLLVLDNFEPVVAHASLVARLVETGGGVMALTTSREPLLLLGEHRVAVEPLDDEYGVELFLERARAMVPELTRLDDERATISAICSRVGGLPLGIELAAARTRQWGMRGLYERSSSLLDALACDFRDAPPRHRSMRDTIAWSVDALGVDERDTFVRSGIFYGGFDVAAAVAVVGRNVEAVSLDLAALVEKNLIVRHAFDSKIERYTLLEPIREYARECSTTGALANVVRARHADHYARLVTSLGPELARGERSEPIAVLEREAANVRAAIATLFAEANVALGLPAATVFTSFWSRRGGERDGHRSLERFIAAAEDDPATARHPAIAPALVEAAWALARRNDVRGSIDYATRAVDRARASGDRETLAAALRVLGSMLSLRDVDDASRDALVESVALARTFASRAFLAHALNSFSVSETRAERFDVALDAAHESIAIFTETGSRLALGRPLENLAVLERSAGRPAAALPLQLRSFDIFRETGDDNGMVLSLVSLSWTYIALDDLSSATSTVLRAYEIATNMDARPVVEMIDLGLISAVLHARVGDPNIAARLCAATERERRLLAIRLVPFEQQYVEEIRRLIDEALGTEGVEALLREGERIEFDALGAEAALALVERAV